MPRFEVTVRTFIRNQSAVANMDVISRTPLGAGISALHALKIDGQRFTLTVKPVMEVRSENS